VESKGAERIASLAPGFTSPVESQQTFRAVLEAMSRPGRIVEAGGTLAPPEPLGPAFGAVCLTLLDFETPVWTDLDPESAAAKWLRFHCGAPLAAGPRDGSFALITQQGNLCPLDRFHPGDDERPEQAATVIVRVEGLGNDEGRRLTGPGIEDTPSLFVGGLPSGFWDERAEMDDSFPSGLDFIFTVERRLAALPRSTRIRE
jgi:alpha-D-ribose 1-methylphosphonate 5-triphosphate synthase subunit PhnH